jgi:hypothetical protein
MVIVSHQSKIIHHHFLLPFFIPFHPFISRHIREKSTIMCKCSSLLLIIAIYPNFSSLFGNMLHISLKLRHISTRQSFFLLSITQSPGHLGNQIRLNDKVNIRKKMLQSKLFSAIFFHFCTNKWTEANCADWQ